MANRSANRRVTDPRLGTENHKKRDLSGVCQNDLLIFSNQWDRKYKNDRKYHMDRQDRRDQKYCID